MGYVYIYMIYVCTLGIFDLTFFINPVLCGTSRRSPVCVFFVARPQDRPNNKQRTGDATTTATDQHHVKINPALQNLNQEGP